MRIFSDYDNNGAGSEGSNRDFVKERIRANLAGVGATVALQKDDVADDLAEDEPDLRELTRIFLEGYGYGVLEALRADFRAQLEKAGMPDNVKQRVLKEVHRLEQIPSASPEMGMVRTWVDWLLDLPWGDPPLEQVDIERAAAILDEDHYGLAKVKDRILEWMAVRDRAQRRADRLPAAPDQAIPDPRASARLGARGAVRRMVNDSSHHQWYHVLSRYRPPHVLYTR